MLKRSWLEGPVREALKDGGWEEQGGQEVVDALKAALF